MKDNVALYEYFKALPKEELIKIVIRDKEEIDTLKHQVNILKEIRELELELGSTYYPILKIKR